MPELETSVETSALRFNDLNQRSALQAARLPFFLSQELGPSSAAKRLFETTFQLSP